MTHHFMCLNVGSVWLCTCVCAQVEEMVPVKEETKEGGREPTENSTVGARWHISYGILVMTY